jgi:hypothetical protein
MVSREEFIELFNELEENENATTETSKKVLTQEERENRVRDWTTLFRRNPDICIEDYLGIKLALFQKQMMNTFVDNDISVDECSRGLSKSFILGLMAIFYACMYSNCLILITAKTISQANAIIDEKIDKIFTKKGTRWSSPILTQLRNDGWITFKTDKDTGGRIVELKNGSQIISAPAIESTRGARSNIVIADEFVLIKKKDYDEIIEPTLRMRDFKGRPADYPEETKQAFLSSAKNKTNWGWKKLKEVVEGHYKDRNIKYGFFAGDIFTAVGNGIQTKQQYIQRKKGADELSFLQEYLNIWLGNSENALLKYEEFERNQVIENAFYPRSGLEIRENVEQKWRFRDDEIRFMAVDIAVSVGSNEDNTAILLGSININNGLRKVYYVDSINGMNSVEQNVLFKRLFYEWKAQYFVMDSTGLGNACFDMLTQPTYDAEVDTTYPAWTVNKEPLLQIVSSAVQNDKIQRTISEDAEEVVIPIVGTASLNTEMHLALRKNLRENKIKFLIDDADAQANFEKDDTLWITRESEYKANKILPFLKTRFLVNESVSVNAEIKENGNIKAVEKTSGSVTTKDLFMALDYFNYFSNKLETKYLKDDEDSGDFDIQDWSFLAELCAI